MPGLISHPYHYVPASNGSIPQEALQAGKNSDGTPLYIARIFHKGDIIPGKVSPGFRYAFASYNCEEHAKKEYEVLCASPSNISWIRGRNGVVPQDSIPVGITSYGEKLFVGRAMYNGSLVPGKVEQMQKVRSFSDENRPSSKMKHFPGFNGFINQK